LAELAKFARKRGFGSLDLQTRYSELASRSRTFSSASTATEFGAML
jgi:hypothetical protein